ncbi:hypothetical protein FF38_04466 [Lucilia cuprina]|uniref:Uncharacterized protein n=1 Tax=Lucilia cuprina TaxID=7375 RepID=A0A0L0CFB8_LUCCU|nr:hypothetical protein FF38_04466 [Lucilia cuprina]
MCEYYGPCIALTMVKQMHLKTISLTTTIQLIYLNDKMETKKIFNISKSEISAFTNISFEPVCSLKYRIFKRQFLTTTTTIFLKQWCPSTVHLMLAHSTTLIIVINPKPKIIVSREWNKERLKCLNKYKCYNFWLWVHIKNKMRLVLKGTTNVQPFEQFLISLQNKGATNTLTWANTGSALFLKH